MNSSENGQLLYHKIMDEYQNYKELSQTYVLSFSIIKDSITLWSEFSDFYGYNLKFNINDLREKIFYNENKYEDIIQEGEVIYDKEKQINIIKSELLDTWNAKIDKKLFGRIRLEEIFDKEYIGNLNKYN